MKRILCNVFQTKMSFLKSHFLVKKCSFSTEKIEILLVKRKNQTASKYAAEQITVGISKLRP